MFMFVWLLQTDAKSTGTVKRTLAAEAVEDRKILSSRIPPSTTSPTPTVLTTPPTPDTLGKDLWPDEQAQK